MRYSCAFMFKEGEPVLAEQYGLDKFKQCLGCQHFSTSCERYVCNHEDGRRCLLQIGVNHYKRSET